MSQQLFTVESGFSIDGIVSILTGAGAPSGVSGTAEALAGIGSHYLENTQGTVYTKKFAGAGADKWILLGTGGSVTGQLYTIITKPTALIGTLVYIYTGFTLNPSNLESENKWAVKRVVWDTVADTTTTAWAGKISFNQVLSSYLSLTYV